MLKKPAPAAPDTPASRLPRWLGVVLSLLLALSAALAGFFLIRHWQELEQVKQGQRFAGHASLVTEQQIGRWRDQLLIASQIGGPPPLRSLTRSGVIAADGASTLQLTNADQDLLNRLRNIQPNQQTLQQQVFEIRGEGPQAQVVGLTAAPVNGRYVLLQWPLSTLHGAMEKLASGGEQVLLTQTIAGQQQQAIRLNDQSGITRSAPHALSVSQWQLTTAPTPIHSSLPWWTAVFGLLSGLLPLLPTLLSRQRKNQLSSQSAVPAPGQAASTVPAPSPVTASPDVMTAAAMQTAQTAVLPSATALPSTRNATGDGLATGSAHPAQSAAMTASPSIASEIAPLGRPVALPVHAETSSSGLVNLPLEPVETAPDTANVALSHPDEAALLPDLEFRLDAPPVGQPLGKAGVQPDPLAWLFRGYDIRGERTILTPDLMRRIGLALGQQLRQAQQMQIVTACDGRIDGSLYLEHLQQGLVEAGLQVIDAGQLPTPALMFAARQFNGNGAIVTASHSPAQMTGLKWMINHQLPDAAALQALRQQLEQPVTRNSGLPGQLRQEDFREAYLTALTDEIMLGQDYRVNIDGMHGSMGELAAEALRRLGCQVDGSNLTADGSFPLGDPDPSQPARLQDLCYDMTIHQSDIGLAFDGDGDRLAVVDSTGQPVPADQLLALFATMALESRPGADIVFDVKCGRLLSQTITRQGGRPVMIRTGSSHLYQAVQASPDVAFAGEFVGHHIFNDGRGWQLDDALYAALRLLEWLGQRGQTLTQALAELPAFYGTPELLIDANDIDRPALLQQLATQAASLPQATVSTLDGVRIEFADGFGLLRQSQTSERLTARFEAQHAEALARIRQTFADLLAAYPQVARQLATGADSDPVLSFL